MNQDFLDYEASYITPQKTLLKKLNKILEYLEEKGFTKLYLHTISFNSQYSGVQKMRWIDNNPEVIKYADLFSNTDILKNAIQFYYASSKVPAVSWKIVGSGQSKKLKVAWYYFQSGSATGYLQEETYEQDLDVISEEVEDY